METIATRDVTAPRASIIDDNAGANAGSSPDARACSDAGPGAVVPDTATKIINGTTTLPMTPSGSRRKILISTHVNLSSPVMCSIGSCALAASIAYRVSGQLEKYIFEVWH